MALASPYFIRIYPLGPQTVQIGKNDRKRAALKHFTSPDRKRPNVLCCLCPLLLRRNTKR